MANGRLERVAQLAIRCVSPDIIRERLDVPGSVGQLQRAREDEAQRFWAVGRGLQNRKLFHYEIIQRYSANLLPRHIIKW